MEIGHTRQAMKTEIAKRGFFPSSFPQLAWSADTPHLLTHEPRECPSHENHAVIATLYWACVTPRQLTYTFFHLSSTLQVRRLRPMRARVIRLGVQRQPSPSGLTPFPASPQPSGQHSVILNQLEHREWGWGWEAESLV